MKFAVATAGGRVSRLVGVVGLAFTLGPLETIRILRNISAARRSTRSVALESYWSRGAISWGDLAVHDRADPHQVRLRPRILPAKDPEFLSKEVTERLAKGDIQFELCLQRYVDDRVTPIEDTSVEWSEAKAVPVPVALLTIRSADAGTAAARALAGASTGLLSIHGIPRSVSTTWQSEPRAKIAYDASAAHRLALRLHEEPPLRNRVLSGLARTTFR